MTKNMDARSCGPRDAHRLLCWLLALVPALALAAAPTGSQAQTGQPLDFLLGGTFSRGFAVNSKAPVGTIAVGQSGAPGFNPGQPQPFGGEAAVWNIGAFVVASPVPPIPGGSFNTFVSVNSDGSVAAGTSGAPGFNSGEAILWSSATGTMALGTLAGGLFSTGQGVSVNSTSRLDAMVVGQSGSARFSQGEAFFWTNAGGMVALGTLPNHNSSTAFALNANSTSFANAVIVGFSAVNTTNGANQAVRWVNGAITPLGFLPGDNASVALAVNADGSVIVGGSGVNNANINTAQAARWVNGVPAPLGVLPGTAASIAFGVSADGSVVVGFSCANGNTDTVCQAFRWTAAAGMQSIRSLIGNNFLNGWNLLGATGVSADGTVIVGYGLDPQGRYHGWIVALPGAGGCPPNLQVDPNASVSIAGGQGGPFAPSSFTYQVSIATGSLGFTVTGVPSWLTVAPGGGTATQTPTPISFTVNGNANSLPAGIYSADLLFSPQQGCATKRTVTLNVGSGLQVSPGTDMLSSGNQGGPFSPSSFTYQLSSTIGSVNFSITGLPTWLNASPLSGTVTTAATTVTFTVNSNANFLGPQTTTSTIGFNNTTNGVGTQTRQATLVVNAPALQVSPPAGINSSGTQGGPFTPSAFQYQVSSTSANSTLGFSITGLPSFITASPTFGFAAGAPTTVTFTVNGNAANLTPNFYSGLISFTNTTNGQGSTTRGVQLAVNPAAEPVCDLPTALGDLDGDGRRDIVWRNNNGAVSAWFMRGATVTLAAGIGTVGTDWSIAGLGDLDGDGKSDIVWRNRNGAVAVWFMNGTQVTLSAGLGSAGSDWQIVAVRDFDGDGKADILWRSNTGGVAIWFMSGTSIKQAAVIGAVGTDWHIHGAGDFDGDGRADILWRNDNGAVAIWFMNGAQVVLAAGVGSVGVDWRVAGVADFDGDGKADILLRNDNGAASIWFMNGNLVASAAGIGAVGPEFRVVGVGDMDGNGKADILYRNGNNGAVSAWFMNGAQVALAVTITSVGTEWHSCQREPGLPLSVVMQ